MRELPYRATSRVLSECWWWLATENDLQLKCQPERKSSGPAKTTKGTAFLLEGWPWHSPNSLLEGRHVASLIKPM